jgi:nucleoid-associated protein YgaU
MKHTIGLIAPQEPETQALLNQQRVTWQQARRQAVRLLLAGREPAAVVAEIRQRYGVWPTMAVRLVRQAQSLLHPGSTARQHYMDYLAGCDDGAAGADELGFYQGLPAADDDALVAVDFRAPEWVADETGGISLLYVPDLKAFYLSLPIANPGGGMTRIEGLPVLFADGEAAELRGLTRGGNAAGKPVVVPSQEMIWWQGTPHLVVGFDPDDCVTGYEAIRQPSRSGMVATAAVAATMTFQSALPVVGVAMAAEAPRSFQVAIAQTPIVKVLDSATGRQLIGVRLVAEDGKVLARSDDSGTLVLPNNYSRYNLFNLVKEGYQFMLLESTQLTPHNLLRVEMSPVTAKGKATTRTAAITPPPSLPTGTKPRTVSQAVHAATPKPPATRIAAAPSRQATRPAVSAPQKPTVSSTQPVVKPTHTTAKAPAAKPQQPVKVAVAPAKPPVHQHATAPTKPPVQHHAAAPTKPQAEQHAKAVLPMTKPVTTRTETRHEAPKPVQTEKAKPQLPKVSKPTKMAEPMAQATQTPRTPAPASTYRVKAGDTLWTIAESQLGAGSRWMSIYAANKGQVSHPSRIQIGQVLQLPQRQQASKASAAKVRITVRPGDSLSLIAKRRLGRIDRWREIYDMNRQTLRNPRLIFPGQTLWIPAR